MISHYSTIKTCFKLDQEETDPVILKQTKQENNFISKLGSVGVLKERIYTYLEPDVQQKQHNTVKLIFQLKIKKPKH